MKLRCMLCGKDELIDEDHPDYENLLDRQPISYICIKCKARLQNEANEQHKPKIPM